MKCKLHVLSHRVLLDEPAVEEKTKGGIALPSDCLNKYQNMQTEGTIVDMAVDAFDFMPEEDKPKIGDVVYYQKYDGIGRKYGSKFYRILVDDMVFAKSDRIIEPEEELYHGENQEGK